MMHYVLFTAIIFFFNIKSGFIADALCSTTACVPALSDLLWIPAVSDL